MGFPPNGRERLPKRSVPCVWRLRPAPLSIYSLTRTAGLQQKSDCGARLSLVSIPARIVPVILILGHAVIRWCGSRFGGCGRAFYITRAERFPGPFLLSGMHISAGPVGTGRAQEAKGENCRRKNVHRPRCCAFLVLVFHDGSVFHDSGGVATEKSSRKRRAAYARVAMSVAIHKLMCYHSCYRGVAQYG